MKERIQKLVGESQKILIIQADNPDGDSLASALTLEEIFGEMGKQTFLYCGVDIPDYLKHIKGWDRVSKDVPAQFDLSIIVDTSAVVLLEKLEQSAARGWVASKPVIVIDHHAEVVADIPYATEVYNDKQAVATGEAIYKLANELGWPLNLAAKTNIAISILSDSLGLSSENTSANTYRIMADLIDAGVDRPALDEARRAYMKMPEAIYRYKADLIKRTELHADGRIAFVDVPNDEITEFSPLYNPAPLIQTDMLQIEGVMTAIVIKHYNDGKITGSIRANHGGNIAANLALHFGGGGHPYAAGFKITNGRPFNEIKSECIQKATELLDNLNKEHSDETL